MKKKINVNLEVLKNINVNLEVSKTSRFEVSNSTIKKDWIECKLGDVGKIETGSTPSKSNNDFYGKEYPFFKPTDLVAGYNVRKANYR